MSVKGSNTFVKAEVLASMKTEKYGAAIVLDFDTGDVLQAACTCPPE